MEFTEFFQVEMLMDDDMFPVVEPGSFDARIVEPES
jgi:hypothetical protein